MPMLMSRTWICQMSKQDISSLTRPSRRKGATTHDVKGVGRPRKLLVDVGEFKGAISEWEGVRRRSDQYRFVSTRIKRLTLARTRPIAERERDPLPRRRRMETGWP